MSLSEYFEEHEEQAFVAKALATAVAINLVKWLFPGLVSFLFLILPLGFLIGLRLHAATSGVDAMKLFREQVTFLPVIRNEDERRSEVKPWVTYAIIFTNVIVFYGFELGAPREVIEEMVFLPHHPDALSVPLSAFSSLFLHASNGHLWGNMTFLWVVGSAVERRVGRLRFFCLYLITGILGGLCYVMVEFLSHGEAGHALGASGAIAGIMGIFAIRCYFKTMIFPVPILGIFSLIIPLSLKIRLNSLLIMALFFLSDLSGGLQQITGESSSMVGHWAHLGGMISGMLIAGYLKLGEAAIEERHLEIGIKASQASYGFQGGERSMQIALQRNPDNVDALLGMARLKTKFHATAEGKELYEKSLAALLSERPGEVVEVYREYLGKYLKVPEERSLLSGLAAALREAGETDLLIGCLERLIELPDLPALEREKALYLLANLLEFTSCFEAARRLYARFAYEYPASILADTAQVKAEGAVYRPPAAAVVEPVPVAPTCPTCGKNMTIRCATSGPKQGASFWVCDGFPGCRSVRPVAGEGERIEPAPGPVSPPRFRLVLDGTIGFNFEPEETKQSLAALFKCSREQVEGLCSGTPTVLKRDLEQAAAVRYRDAINATGASCRIEAEEPTAPAVTAARGRESAALTVPVGKGSSDDAKPSFACPKCGYLQEKSNSCLACGVYFAKVAKAAERELTAFNPARPGAERVMSEQQERRWAMLCHLVVLSGVVIPLGNILGPLLIWRWKRSHSEFVDFHGRTAVNYQLTLFLFGLALGVVGVVTGFAAILIGPLIGVLGLYTIVMTIIAVVRSRRGDYFQLPLSAEFLK